MADNSWTKDPDAVLDWQWDWSDWLDDGETIASNDVTVDGVTVDSTSASDTTVTAWLSGGTAGSRASASCEITTSQSRTDERTIYLTVTER